MLARQVLAALCLNVAALVAFWLMPATGPRVIDFNVTTVSALHHQGPFFPIPRSQFPLELRMEETGIWSWTYEQRCANCNILPDVAGAFDDTAQHYGVLFLYGDSPGQRNISTSGAEFVGACGAQAVACVGSDFPGYPLNCDAKYDGAYMATFYSFASRKSVPKHEWKHCSTRRAEDYDDDQTDGTPGLRCIPSLSIMGCGPNHPLDYSPWDDQLWAQEHFPPPVAGAALQGGLLFYAATNDRATRIAVLADSGAGYYFLGYAPACTADGFVCGSFRLPILVAGTRVYAKAENAISWPYATTEVLAGEVR